MRTVIAGTLVTALPLLVAVGLVAAPKPKAAAPVQIPITGQAQDAAGNRYTLSGTVTLTSDSPLPTPTPDPVSIVSLTVKPASVLAGQASTGTITLNRAPLVPVQIAVKSLDRGLTVAESVTINPGQASGTFAIGTPAAQSVAFWFSLSATYNGQSKAASLLVQPAGTPTPTPTPTPEPPLPVEPASPMVDRVTSDGMTLTVKGIGLGTAPGSLWWNGYPVPVTRWSDTEASGPILWPSGAAPDWWGVQTAAGGLNASLAAPEQGEPVLPVPDSRRR